MKAKAKVANVKKLDAHHELPDDAPLTLDAAETRLPLSTFVEEHGDDKYPLSEAYFREEMYAALGYAGIGERPSRLGVRRYAPALRALLTRETFTQESGAIQKEIEFDYTQPCSLAHPGLCRTADAFFYEIVKNSSKVLRQFVPAKESGTMVLLSFGAVPARTSLGPLQEREPICFVICTLSGGTR